MNKYYGGIDLGGTKIIGVIVNDNFEVVEKTIIKTGDTSEGKIIINKIITMIESFKRKYKIDSIGVGSAGFVDNEKGIVISSPNIKFLSNFQLSSKIEKGTGIETFIDNDVKAGAIGELYLGEGRNTSNFVFVTLGTGIGAAIIINKKILRGSNNLAGEMGHFSMNDKGHKCGCGKIGCLETISSGPAIRRYVIDEIKKGKISKALEFAGTIENIDVMHIVKAAKEKDMLSEEALLTAVKTFSKALSYVINLLNPEKIILGGGLYNAYKEKNREFIEYLKKYTLSIPLENVKIVKAKLGNDAVAIGASIIGMKRTNKKRI